MRRLAGFASGFGLLVTLSSAARAAEAPVPTARVVAAPNIDLARLLRLTPWRELGVAGVDLRLRAPAPLGAYVEARLGDGVSAGRPDGALVIPGTVIGLAGSNGAQGAGAMSTRGVDLGVDAGRFERGYLSLAVGWLRSTWPVGGFDDRARLVATSSSLDGLMFKIGVSF